MLDAQRRVAELHRIMRFKETGGEDPLFRVALLAEEVGEVASCITKNDGNLAEEHADLLIVLLGNCVSFGIDVEEAFNRKLDRLMRMTPVTDGAHARLITSRDE